MLDAKAPPERLPSGKLSKAVPKLDPAQQEVADLLMERYGIPTICVNTLEGAIDALKTLGVPVRGRAL